MCPWPICVHDPYVPMTHICLWPICVRELGHHWLRCSPCLQNQVVTHKTNADYKIFFQEIKFRTVVCKIIETLLRPQLYGEKDLGQHSVGSGNALLPDGTEPLPETMLISHYWGSVTFTREQFHSECTSCIMILKITSLKLQPHLPEDNKLRLQCVNSSPPSAAYMRQWIESTLV